MLVWERTLGGAVLDFDAERKKANALLLALGPAALQRVSNQADTASLYGNNERAAYWRRVMALILQSSMTFHGAAEKGPQS